MLKAKSNRNRHTGKINAYKAHVIHKGEEYLDNKGRTYVALYQGEVTATKVDAKVVSVPKFSIVKVTPRG